MRASCQCTFRCQRIAESEERAADCAGGPFLAALGGKSDLVLWVVQAMAMALAMQGRIGDYLSIHRPNTWRGQLQ